MRIALLNRLARRVLTTARETALVALAARPTGLASMTLETVSITTSRADLARGAVVVFAVLAAAAGLAAGAALALALVLGALLALRCVVDLLLVTILPPECSLIRVLQSC